MSVTLVQPDRLHDTQKVGYSHAFLAAGRLLFVSGQVALDGQGRLVGPGDVEAQTVQAFENLRVVLEEAGAGFSDLARLNVYITDPRFTEPYRRIRRRYLREPFPASTLVVVAGLADPDWLIEIEAVAAID
ncbi:MAG: RidA family protein [Alphaproteobacteria bacterium]